MEIFFSRGQVIKQAIHYNQQKYVSISRSMGYFPESSLTLYIVNEQIIKLTQDILLEQNEEKKKRKKKVQLLRVLCLLYFFS